MRLPINRSGSKETIKEPVKEDPVSKTDGVSKPTPKGKPITIRIPGSPGKAPDVQADVHPHSAPDVPAPQGDAGQSKWDEDRLMQQKDDVRLFMHRVSPTIELQFEPENGDNPYLSNMRWIIEDGIEYPAYLITVDKPSENQYHVLLEEDFLNAHTQHSDVWIVFYLRISTMSAGERSLTGVWIAHIKEIFDLLDSCGKHIPGSGWMIDVRLFDCYSVNTLGGPPVRLAVV